MSEKPAKKLLAYCVNDGQESSVVVFATSAIAARRKGAREMDCDFESVDYCRREQAFDAYAPGPVPPLVLISHGWWWECAGCWVKIREGMEDYDESTEYGPFITADMAIDVGGHPYCCHACHVADVADRAARYACDDATVARLTQHVLSRVPRAEIVKTYCYVDKLKDSEDYTATDCRVEFTWPGGTYSAELKFTRELPEMLFWVKQVDLEAWDAYQASVAAWRRQRNVAV